MSMQHRQGNADEEKLGVTISVDYAFKSAEEAEDDISPILVAYDNSCKSIWTLEVDHKGVDANIGVDWLNDKLVMSGYAGVKITLKSDNEASKLAFKNALAVKRQAETALIESPVRESKANSHVERAIRTWRDQYRTLRSYTEHRLNAKITKESAVNSWLVAWAADVLNRFKVQANGRTSYEMMTQHRCRHKVVAFGEKIFSQHTKNAKTEYRKDVGIFLGMMGRSNTFIVGNAEGIFGSPNVMSFPDEQAFDAELVAKLSVIMYDFVKSGVSQPPGAHVV